MTNMEVNGLNYSYRTKYQTVHAVSDVSFRLEAGLLYALIGKSGSGKSTLLSMLAGLERPDSGKILVNGEDLQGLDIDLYRRKRASVIYQSFNLFPLMTVQENVMYPLLLNQFSKKEAATQAQTMLLRVGLDGSYWRRLPAMLSGGEQQRVAIARALGVHAEVILADEPTGNLDGENTRQIVELLHRMAHEELCCVLIVTHDTEVAKTADRVFLMDSGRLTEGSL